MQETRKVYRIFFKTWNDLEGYSYYIWFYGTENQNLAKTQNDLEITAKMELSTSVYKYSTPCNDVSRTYSIRFPLIDIFKLND